MKKVQRLDSDTFERKRSLKRQSCLYMVIDKFTTIIIMKYSIRLWFYLGIIHLTIGQFSPHCFNQTKSCFNQTNREGVMLGSFFIAYLCRKVFRDGDGMVLIDDFDTNISYADNID